MSGGRDSRALKGLVNSTTIKRPSSINITIARRLASEVETK